MKIFCNNCGIHFKDEFEATTLPPCNYWGDMGLGTLPAELKQKLWDWLFMLPSDEIAIKTGIGVGIYVTTTVIKEEQKFENLIPGYKEMPEEEKKLAQKAYFKNIQDTNPNQTVPDKSIKKERMVH